MNKVHRLFLDRARVFLRVLLIGSLICASFSATAAGQDREFKIKAVYLLHFANFIEWPESAFKKTDEMEICTYQDNPFGLYLEEIEGQQGAGKTLKINLEVDISQINACHILYVGQSHTSQLAAIKKQIGSDSVLVISEQEDFEEVGGIISYFVENNKLRIAIDADAASAANLKISSKLLQIAKRIKRRSNYLLSPLDKTVSTI